MFCLDFLRMNNENYAICDDNIMIEYRKNRVKKKRLNLTDDEKIIKRGHENRRGLNERK